MRHRLTQQQGGFTLIEVLVSMLILLVGVLGVAGMQMISWQNNQGSYFRSQAMMIGVEALDAMRSNRTALADYVGIFPVDGASVSTVPTSPACETTNDGCTAAQAAAVDIRELSAHFVDVFSETNYRPTLPGGSIEITQTGDEYAVTVSWAQRQFDNTNSADGSDTRSVVTETVTLTSSITP